MKNSKLVYGFIVLCVVSIGFWALVNQKDAKQESRSSTTNIQERNSEMGESADSQAPQSMEFASNKQPKRKSPQKFLEKLLPDDIKLIREITQKLKVDDENNLVIDESIKTSLESAFSGLDLNLSDDKLDQVQDIIRMGLKEPASDQAAKLFLDYYNYRVAEVDFLAGTFPNDVQSIRNNFDQLVSLREAHLGYETSNKLYAEEHSNTRKLLMLMEAEGMPEALKEHSVIATPQQN